MKQTAKEKIVVLVTAFTFFIGGVLALFYMERGTARTVVLALAIFAMALVALWQSLKRTKKQ